MSYRSRYNRKSTRPSYPRRDSYRSDNSRRFRNARGDRYSYDNYDRKYSAPRHHQSGYRQYAKPSRHSKYLYSQPSGPVYVEEPETEDDVASESEYDGFAQSDDDEGFENYDHKGNRFGYSKQYAYPDYSMNLDSEEDFELDSEGQVYDSEFDSELNSEIDSEFDSELEAEIYSELDSELDSGSDSDETPEGYEEIFVVPNDDGDMIDINDILEEQFYDDLEAEGKVQDVNDDLVRFYDDSESDSEIDTDSDSDSDSDSGIEEIQEIIEFDSDSESESESDSESSDSESSDDEILLIKGGEAESESESDSECGCESDSETDLELDSEEEAEFIRQVFADKLESSDELSTEEEEDDDVFFEVDSDFYNSDDEDIVVDSDLSEYNDSDSDSDDEGITIYRHKFDLPDRYDSDNDSTDPELDLSEDEMLMAEDLDDEEFEVIDLSKDLKDSKDCEVEELDENTYKLTLRLPSIIKEDLDIKFLKNENELVINGKFNFTGEETDSEDDEDFEEDDEEEQGVTAEVEVAEASSDSESESESDSDSDSSSSSSDSETSSGTSSSESEDTSSESEDEEVAAEIEVEEADEKDAEESDNEEEVVEDAQNLIKDFKNHEIQFEKRYQFDKIIKFDEIKASFLENGELQLIIPNEGESSSRDENTISIAIEGIEPKAIAAAETAATDDVQVDAVVEDVEMAA